ncbi:heparinase II/III family protein, partial [Streptomyces albidoflavus]
LWQLIVSNDVKSTDAFNEKLLREIQRWANWLADDRNYRANNHGLMASISLLYVYVLLGRQDGRQYYDIASNRILVLMDQSFDSSGLCNENSVGYHSFNLSLYKAVLLWAKSHNIDESFVQKLQDTVERATNALAICVFQNGDIPPLGDSSIYPSSLASRLLNKTIFICLYLVALPLRFINKWMIPRYICDTREWT